MKLYHWKTKHNWHSKFYVFLAKSYQDTGQVRDTIFLGQINEIHIGQLESELIELKKNIKLEVHLFIGAWPQISERDSVGLGD